MPDLEGKQEKAQVDFVRGRLLQVEEGQGLPVPCEARREVWAGPPSKPQEGSILPTCQPGMSCLPPRSVRGEQSTSVCEVRSRKLASELAEFSFPLTAESWVERWETTARCGGQVAAYVEVP